MSRRKTKRRNKTTRRSPANLRKALHAYRKARAFHADAFKNYKLSLEAHAAALDHLSKAILDPRPAVHQCIVNAGATEPFSPSAPLSSINADPTAVQACVNGVFVIKIIVTKSDSENSIVTKVENALS